MSLQLTTQQWCNPTAVDVLHSLKEPQPAVRRVAAATPAMIWQHAAWCHVSPVTWFQPCVSVQTPPNLGRASNRRGAQTW